MSVIGSVIFNENLESRILKLEFLILYSRFHQLDFLTPGISPLLANSLKQILQSPNFLIKPCLLPHLKQRLCRREENFGFIFAFASCDVLAIMLLLRKRNSKL